MTSLSSFNRSGIFRDDFSHTRHIHRIIASFVIGSVLFFLIIGTVQSPAPNGQPQHKESLLASAQPFELNDDELVFAAAMLGAESAEEGQYMIKSLIMHTSRPLSLHIIATPNARDFIENRLVLVQRPAIDIRVSFYIMTKKQIVRRARSAGIHAVFMDAGEFINMKMFIHEILPMTAKKAIFLDTDAFFLIDPYIMWRDYAQIPDDRYMSLTHNGPEADKAGLCSCVMGFNLQAMRNPEAPFLPSKFIPGSEKTAIGTAEVWNASGTDPNHPMYGDQGLYWAMWKYWGDNKFGRLSRTWNLEGCHNQQNLQLDAEQDRTIEKEIENQSEWFGSDHSDVGPMGIFYPGILHFNCHGDKVPNIFEKDNFVNIHSWGGAVRFVRQYKWVWLNRGTQDSLARLVTYSVEKPTFWDEIVHMQGLPSTL